MQDEKKLVLEVGETTAAVGEALTLIEEVRSLGLVLPFEENRPVEERLGRIRGMLAHLRSRPMPLGRHGSEERGLLKVLTTLAEMGEELAGRSPSSLEALNQLAIDRQVFEDLLYAATQDFFALLDAIDEPFPV